MLSSIHRSKTAIQVNIQIMRAFTRIRQLILDSADLRREIEELRQETDGKFRIVFRTLEQLLAEEAQPKKKIGFTAKEKLPGYGKYIHESRLTRNVKINRFKFSNSVCPDALLRRVELKHGARNEKMGCVKFTNRV